MPTFDCIRGFPNGFGMSLLGIVRRIHRFSLYVVNNMKAPFRKRLSRLRIDGPLVPFLHPYMDHLARQGFSQVAFLKKTLLMSEFSKWLKEQNVGMDEISTDHPGAFLRHRGRSLKILPGDSFALAGVLTWLKERKVLGSPIRAELSERDRLLQQYSKYLQEERGLEQTTISQYTGCMRDFLRHSCTGKQVQLSALRPTDVFNFVRQYAPRKRTFSRGKAATTALRSFLRFARLRGRIEVDLAAAVPAVPGWSMTSIPRAMPLKVVRRVLACSRRRRTPVGLRDYAILLLLARLGLRAREVILLKLDDIDWRGGCLRVQGKGRQERPLPMPADVGEAIATYLRNGRPTTTDRRVFQCMRAPLRGLGGSPAVAQILRCALARAGIELPRKGTHQFRHALATEMLHKGMSLTEIGQLLRHRSPDATRRYAKVDLRTLREVAMPWPGGLP